MSAETMEWLNTNTLVGFVANRGNAWHYRADLQGEEPNHYTEAIPVADVQRRLFDWEAVERPLYMGVPADMDSATSVDDNGNLIRFQKDDTRKAIVHGRTGEVFGVFKDGYVIHQYQDALIRNIQNLVDDDIQIGSAGLLRNGGAAWVSLEMDENVHTKAGMEFRPHLLAATSHNGTLASTYKRVTTRVVCDNTCEMALAEDGQVVKVKHSKHSSLKIASARDVLGILTNLGEKAAAEIDALAAWTVTPAEFRSFMEKFVPVPAEADAPQAAVTRAVNTRAAMIGLWERDERVTPWKGTALGVQQMVNTHRQHVRTVSKANTDRLERNMLDLLHGRTGEADRDALRVLAAVTGR